MANSGETHIPFDHETKSTNFLFPIFIFQRKRTFSRLLHYTYIPCSHHTVQMSWLKRFVDLNFVHTVSRFEHQLVLFQKQKWTLLPYVCKKAHIETVENERSSYKHSRDEESRNPEKFCFTITDRADQSTFSLSPFTKTKDRIGNTINMRLIKILEQLLVKHRLLFIPWLWSTKRHPII